MMTMLILRGKAGHYGGKDWPRGALDEPPALEYAQRRGYSGKVLDIAGVAVENSPQTRMALAEFRRDVDVAAIYGFSAGGYNVLHFLDSLSPVECKRLRLVVVLGAPGNSADKYNAHKFSGNWELVYRTDPPEGHMHGPKVLLASLP
jgi:hypothetical protein